jgi:phosphoenolpyruvate phosphomutase
MVPVESKARKLRRLFQSQSVIRIMGAHDGLGAKLIEKNGFDGVWASGLEISTAHAVPDANILTMTENLEAATAMNEATVLPIICDCDTGYGNSANVQRMVKKYESAGIAAVVIEDKLFPKVNSFIPGRQELASIEEFMGKIEAAKNAQVDPDFMVFARVEALIAGWGMEEALKRAYAFTEAGADGIVIHSKLSEPSEIFEFAEKFKGRAPIVVIPTTFYKVKADAFAAKGVRMVIYANHGLRASITAMDAVFREIRETGSSESVEKKIASLKDVFEIQGMHRMTEDEQRYGRRDTIAAVIPAAGDHRFQEGFGELLKDRPLCMLDIAGETLLTRQTTILRAYGVSDFTVVGGYRADKIRAEGIRLLENKKYAETGSAYSILSAGEALRGKTLVVYSDILFDRSVPERLLASPHPITVVIDRAYRTLPSRSKALDLVVTDEAGAPVSGRRLDSGAFKTLRRIGAAAEPSKATHEFIGMAYFREEGVQQLKSAWETARARFAGRPFYGAASVERADLVELLQFLIDEGVPVQGLEVEHGWSEIHSVDDWKRVSDYCRESSDLSR